MRLGMKKSDITASLLIIITCILLVILLSLRSIDGVGTVPSYSFLAGRNPIKYEKADKGNEDKRYIYSFEADYDDLWSKAYSELKPAGFTANGIVRILSGKESKERTFQLKEKFPRGSVLIYIYNNVQYIKHTNSSNFDIAPKDGWVMVEIVYYRGWRWPF
jgi:hypothetical protein